MPSDIFAKLGDIKGESLDAKHKDEIEVLSFSWGVTNTVTPGRRRGGGAGKTTFHDLSFVHRIDRASPLLMKACATGTHIKEATLTNRKAGKTQHEYLIVKMNDIIITGVAPSAVAGQPDTGSEMVTLTFAKVDLEYKTQNPNGSLGGGVSFTYDLNANKTF